ncbi:hypothetical protein BHE74_00049881 [Ensete ventricosum]|nr:hypothetical protein BHE74_00049881 [Ensete ventricosum]RZS16590.1 hypothetical protein BHM03_00048611 [Ensete ventricosum]
MASLQLAGTGNPAVARRYLPSIDGLRLSPFPFRLPSSIGACGVALERSCFRGLVVKAAAVVAPKVQF